MDTTQSRRGFMKTLGLVTGTIMGAGSFLGISACNIYTDIMNYVPVALAAFTTVVTLINPAEGSIVAGLVTMVKAALSDIQAAVEAYENAPASQKQTLSGKISTAITAAESVLQQFWSDLKLPDGNIATLVENIINIILSTFMAFLPKLAPPAALPVKAYAKKVAYTAKKRSLGEFKSDLNAEFVKAGYTPIFK